MVGALAVGLAITVSAQAQVDPDFNGDGVADPSDVAQYIAAWWHDVSTGTLVTDADADGAVTPADIAVFMRLWLAAVEQPARGGWTPLEPPIGARVIHVSSSDGKPTNDGLTRRTPVLTLAQGVALLRDGYPDQLLLKKGDTWPDETLGDFRKSGRSSADRMVISSYGVGPRPKVIPPSGSSAISRSTDGSKGHLAIVGIHFEAAPRDEYNSPGIIWLDGNQQGGQQPLLTATDLLIEDCRFSRLFRGMEVQNVNNLAVRRCQFEDICSRTGSGFSPEAVYTAYCSNLTIEENYVVTRAFAAGDPHFVRNPYQQDNFFYMQDANLGTNTIRRNILVSKGVQGPLGIELRCHGTVSDNVVDGCHTGISIGSQDTPPSGLFPGGTHATVTGNVVLRGVNMTSQAGGERAIGIHFGYHDTVGTLIADNIVANKGVVAEDGTGIRFDQYYFQGPARNVTIERNIVYNWNGFDVNFGGQNVSGVVFRGNFVQNPDVVGSEMPLVDVYTTSPLAVLFSGNTYDSHRPASAWFRVAGGYVPKANWLWIEPTAAFETANYPAPNRSLASYMQSLGLPGTTDAAIDAFLTQSRDSWNTNYTIDSVLAYFRAGFGQ